MVESKKRRSGNEMSPGLARRKDWNKGSWLIRQKKRGLMGASPLCEIDCVMKLG